MHCSICQKSRGLGSIRPNPCCLWTAANQRVPNPVVYGHYIYFLIFNVTIFLITSQI
nr:MAG TPA: Glutathione-dependent formaldehyde-activating enzyme [Bacteriophage sp.]